VTEVIDGERNLPPYNDMSYIQFARGEENDRKFGKPLLVGDEELDDALAHLRKGGRDVANRLTQESSNVKQAVEHHRRFQ
jgi:hypothetical protein